MLRTSPELEDRQVVDRGPSRRLTVSCLDGL
jgi:hypothetical protein